MTMTCNAQRPAPLRCPTFQEVLDTCFALLPLGRAWQSRDGGPAPYIEAVFDPSFVQDDAFATIEKPGTVMFRFWSAIAAPLHFLQQRLCDLRLEFWCATMSETRAEWMLEYGLPDDCDPFPDLCTKVAALGGQRCDYFRDILDRSGWKIECFDLAEPCGDGVGCINVGCSQVGVAHRAKLLIVVDTNESPAYIGGVQTPPQSGLSMTGMGLNSCDPDIDAAKCWSRASFLLTRKLNIAPLPDRAPQAKQD